MQKKKINVKSIYKMKTKIISFLSFVLLINNLIISQSTDIRNQVEHHYANNNGVKIHYVTMGKGPVILFIHGFPDFWFTWRNQMKSLSKTHKVVAMDLRGYNLSDSPKGAENYTYDFLMNDISSVINNLGEKSVYLVAHDWGAAISWNFAAHFPNLIKKLVILNISHPKAGDKKPFIPIEDRQPSYADHFASDEFKKQLTASWFSGWIIDPEIKKIYQEAFHKSDKEAMINYYKANYPLLENLKNKDFLKRVKKPLPNIKMPVLIIHGKKDTYSLTKSHNNTWNFVDNELTIHVLPNAGHFIQRDESNKVSLLIKQFILKK